MLVNGNLLIELEEGERELLHDALDILSPDSTEASERLEILTQTMLDATLEPGSVEMEFSVEDMELAIAALDVVQPDDFEMQDLAGEMAERFRSVHRDCEDVPGM